jgi:ABC-type glycerol-3-phosphate transport system permease component
LDEIYIFPPRLFAHNPTLKNFQEIAALADTFWVPMSRYLFNTILICSVTTLGHLLLSSLAAYPLALHNFPGKRFLNTMVKWSLLFTSAAMLLPQYVVMSKLKIINTYWAIILPAMQSSLGLYLMMNFMTQVPQGLLEAARLDGASEWRVWYQIVMPNIKPAWLTVMIFTFQAIWNTTGTTQMTQLIYDEKYKMVSSLLSQIVSGGTARAGVGSAFSLLLMLPPVILFILCQSRIIETMSSSGMK